MSLMSMKFEIVHVWIFQLFAFLSKKAPASAGAPKQVYKVGYIYTQIKYMISYTNTDKNRQNGTVNKSNRSSLCQFLFFIFFFSIIIILSQCLLASFYLPPFILALLLSNIQINKHTHTHSIIEHCLLMLLRVIIISFFHSFIHHARQQT